MLKKTRPKISKSPMEAKKIMIEYLKVIRISLKQNKVYCN